MLLFWGLVVVGIVSIVRWLLHSTGSRGHSDASTSSQAMNILKERFARGELTRDEFESMKKEILQ
jgi:putative membrane protein